MKSRRTMGLLRSDSAIKTRNVDVVHGAERVVRNGRLEVDTLGHRCSILVVGGHDDVGRLMLLKWMIDVSGLRVRL